MPPKISRYAQPQQYSRTQRPVPGDVSQSHLSDETIQAVEYRTPSAADPNRDEPDPKPAIARITDDENASEDRLNIRETGEEELDIEGALAALPPNLRDVARRQLEAIHQTSKAKSAETSDPIESRVITASSVESASKGKTNPQDSVVNAVALKPETSHSVSTATLVKKHAPDLPSMPPSTETAASRSPSENSSPGSSQGADDDLIAEKSDSTLDASLAATRQWGPTVVEAISNLERELKDHPTSDENLRLNHELTLRLLYLANRQLNEAMRPIEGLEGHEQEYFRYQLQALYEAGNPDAMPVKSRRWSLVMNSQRQATNQLAAASNLEVRSLAFCTDVQGYGVLTKFPNYQFKPDQEILLYCELENVQAEQVKAGFETQLQGTYEIIDPNGRRIADQLLPMECEICQNSRRDFFIIYHIFMPMQIAPGNYQMRVTIEDMKAHKFGQSNLDFQIQK